ncbi:UDP-N-acetylmuramate dehydrogenase [Alkalibacter saccharofermentans]|uniref:UDP-N-acetylenolpyruvoylglucosamine reductase n=1 Tax=Alkalibacter saccharofermentans DSM 14828 TaxID=1120975 RepID=A0A1M4VW34_9FIRM|nr:UDP-N-acetylmuramate dehydrogenase [Alkalibacter saccharofermentans]SHE73179.1 UDP-N-acetylmuramate dehydrogenase [Alkalibacter saccharofermentans DSM 14828]
MNNKYIYTEFLKVLDSEKILTDAPMKNHTSFKAGGCADYLLIPDTEDEIKLIIEICKQNNVPYYIMGNGSNLLVKDKGYRGVIIKLGKNFSKCTLIDNDLDCQSGVFLSRLAKIALDNELSGFEFASGIPGTLGGAVTMNAGAYDGEMKDVLVSIRGLDMDGNIIELANGDLELGYRTSAVKKRNLVVLSAKIRLESGNKKKIKEKMEDFDERRKSKQPLELPSAGSAFKRPVGHYAGKLIEDSGLKGFAIGGAQVSTKHCGFIVNINSATAKDILDLIDHIIKTVKDNFNVILEPEVKIIGED